jgi:Flp pilus assembly pilin Flp
MEVHVPGFRPFLRTLVKSDSGVTALEYGLILSLIAVVAIGAISGVGDKLARNFDIVITAVSDPPAPGDILNAPSGDDGGTESEPAGETAETPVADGSAAADDDGGGNSTETTVDEQADRSSGGEKVGSGTSSGGTDPANTAAASTADGSGSGSRSGAGSGSGSTGPSGAGSAAAGSDGASDPGGGQDGDPGNAEPGEESPLFGRDSTRVASRDDTASRSGDTGPREVATSVSAGEARSTDPAPGGSGESPLQSAIILLLWLCLGIAVIILGWKIILQAATKKDAKEQLENWEPASFGKKNVAQLG